MLKVTTTLLVLLVHAHLAEYQAFTNKLSLTKMEDTVTKDAYYFLFFLADHETAEVSFDPLQQNNHMKMEWIY